MVHITLKQRIKVALEQSGYDFFYGISNKTTFPYIRYTLGSNFSNRLSNKKAVKNIWYQVDIFSDRPIDVEEKETMLSKVEYLLEENGLFTTDWVEGVDPENSTGYPVYHYFLEVRS